MAALKRQQNDFLKTQNIDWGDDEWNELEHDMDMGSSGVANDIWKYPRDTCILCQEETNDQRLYGSMAYIDQSNIFRQTNVTDKDHVQEVDATPTSLDHSAEDIRPFGMAGNNVEHVQRTGGDGKIVTTERRGLGKGWDPACTRKIPLTTGCGHLMHFSCFESFNAATERRHNYQIARLHPERLGQNEFVCPLCKALGNSFLPIIWKPMRTCGPTSIRIESFDQWITVQAPFLVSRAFDRTTYGKSYATYIEKSLIQTYSSKLTAPSQSKPSFTESRTSSLNIPSFLTRSRPSMPLRDPHAAVSRSQDGQDGPTAELLKAYRRLQQTMQLMGLQSMFGLAGSPQSEAVPSYVNQINAEHLANALGGSIANVEIAQRGVGSSDASSFIEKIPEQTVAHLRVFSATCSSFVAVYGMYQNSELPDVSVLIRRQVMQLFAAREGSFWDQDNNSGRETL